tara:strand:+ start:1262 stop:1537 length:276 start_codon:yes stop_codon:yes gene_type:complete
MKKTSDPVGSTEFKVWYRSLTNDFTEEEFMNGIKAAQDHTKFLDLPNFRQLCRLTKSHRSHAIFSIEKKEKMLTGAELRAKIAEMRKNLDI